MSKAAFLEVVSVSRETERRLVTFAELLTKWNRHINLVSASTLKDLWSRHFLDSAQLLSLAEGRSGLWLDVGTGGGFPGIVVAIIAAEASTGTPGWQTPSPAARSPVSRAMWRQNSVT